MHFDAGWAVVPHRVVAWLVLLLGLVASIVHSGCGPSNQPRPDGPMRIVVSIAPLAGLVREVAPDAEVSVLVPAGVSEHGYELTPGDVDRLRRADLIVGVGLGLEPRLEEVVRRLGDDANVLWFAECLTPEELAAGATEDEHDHADHDHDGDGHDDHAHDDHGHDHSAGDPHLWLDPVLVEKFVEKLGDRIGRLHAQKIGVDIAMSEPARTEVGVGRQAIARDQTTAIIHRVQSVDARARGAMTPLAGRAIVTHHASHGRFAARYGLRIAATIRVSETMEPTPGQVEAAVRAIRAEDVPAVFVEPQFDSTTAARIAREAGVRVVVLDPMGDGDWFALMDHTITTIADALSTPATPAAPTPEGSP